MKDGAVYEDMMDFKTLKKYMENQLEDYNMEPGVIAMDLVLFRDAIEHGNNNHKILFCVLNHIRFSTEFLGELLMVPFTLRRINLKTEVSLKQIIKCLLSTLSRRNFKMVVSLE